MPFSVTLPARSLTANPFPSESLTLNITGEVVGQHKDKPIANSHKRPRWLRECMAEATGVFFYV